MACQASNNGGLAFDCHGRFYTLGTDVDRRREGMDKGREEDNGHSLRMYSLESSKS